MNNFLSEKDIKRILSNPYYCLPHFINEHPAMVEEEQWIMAGAELIKEIGAENYLKELLENLKGNFV